MNTYYSTNLENASMDEINQIVSHLESAGDLLTTIQWNYDDSLYTIETLSPEITNVSDHGLIWYYRPASQLLAEINAQLEVGIFLKR
jgi:hypothetical protein